MRFLDWLWGRKRVQASAEFIWLNRHAKYKGLSRQLAEVLQQGSPAIVAAYFPATLDDLTSVLEQTSLSFEVAQRPLDAVAFAGVARSDGASRVLLGLLPTGWNGHDPPADRRRAQSDAPPVQLIVLERHPLASVDEATVALLASLPCRVSVAYHLALDDPLMKRFAGDWVRRTLQQLGMTEDEAISSALVSRRFAQACRKIEQQATGNQAAQSADEWLRVNCPSLTLG